MIIGASEIDEHIPVAVVETHAMNELLLVISVHSNGLRSTDPRYLTCTVSARSSATSGMRYNIAITAADAPMRIQ